MSSVRQRQSGFVALRKRAQQQRAIAFRAAERQRQHQREFGGLLRAIVPGETIEIDQARHIARRRAGER